jgi:hypothetical protein
LPQRRQGGADRGRQRSLGTLRLDIRIVGAERAEVGDDLGQLVIQHRGPPYI